MKSNDCILIDVMYLNNIAASIVLHGGGGISLNININKIKFMTNCDMDISRALIDSIIDLFTTKEYNEIHSKLQHMLLNQLKPWDNVTEIMMNRYLFCQSGKFDIIDNSCLLNLKNFSVSVALTKMIFIINGSGGVGKDEFIKRIKFVNDISVDNISSIDPIKNTLKELADYISIDMKNKSDESRKLMADTKHILDKFEFTENYISYNLNEFLNSPLKNNVNYNTKEHYKFFVSDMVFVHIREPENITKIVNKFSAYTILMERDNVEKIDTNIADANVGYYDYDLVIDNSGSLEELDNTTISFVDACTAKKSIIISFK